MSSPLSPEEIERLARKRAGAKMGWYIHATVYVLVNLLIFSLSQYAFGNRPWSLGPLLGWGVGLVLHGISVFVLGSSSTLRERMVQRERERIEQSQSGR
jgi:fatty acid desaturase